jgi:hypothetical protein
MITFTRRVQQASPDVDEFDTKSEEAPQPLPLVLLAADAASPAARRLHRFPGAAAAADFIGFWFPPEKRSGLIAFWSLPEAPLSVAAEALVIIRDERDPTLVYPFSFLDVRSAMAFAADEAGRGIDPACISITFAVPVEIESVFRADEEEIFLTPAVPPERPRPLRELPSETRWAYRIDTPAVSEEPAILPEDLVERVLNVLRFRRWGVQANPFAGFGSPPGRF